MSNLRWSALPAVFTVLVGLNLCLANQPQHCSLPPETGPCRAAFPRFYFDPSTQSCKTFIYGGCEGNANNFLTEAECRLECLCSQPASLGVKCAKSSRKFFFDVTKGSCRRFRFAGCRGNGNRFDNFDSCNSACAYASCLLPQKVGPCKAAFKRFFYNATSQKCEQFIFGGCQQNKNNFRNVAGCVKKCEKPLTSVFSTQPGGSGDFVPIGDPGLSRTDLDPDCFLSKQIGRCRGAFPRYYYDTASDSCKPFDYGGCGGNANNFETKVACSKKCMRN